MKALGVKGRAKTRDVRRYFAIILLGPLVLAASWAFFKVAFEDKFAGHAAGYPGLVFDPAPDVLFMGSSHTRQSYDVAAVEAATGRTAYIFAYNSVDLSLMNLLLQELLTNPAHRPRVLVLEAYSAKLARTPDLGDARLFFDLPPPLKLKLIADYLSHNPGLSAWLDVVDLAVNRGTEQILTYPLNNTFTERLSYKGAYRGHVVKGMSEDEFRSVHAEIAGEKPNPAQLTALLQIIELCRLNGVRLILAESPMPSPISSMAKIQSLKRAFRNVSSTYGLPYFDGDETFPTNSPAFFGDSNHLSTAGRELFTSNLINRFSALFKGSSPVANSQARRLTSSEESGLSDFAHDGVTGAL